MLRIAIQSKGRLYDDTISLLAEADIRLPQGQGRGLLAVAKGFPLEALFLRDDDIPDTVRQGVADIGIVGENELLERQVRVPTVKRLGFSRCRLSLAIPKNEEYSGVRYFEHKKIATSYPNILHSFLDREGIKAEIHVIAGSVEIAPSIGLGDAIFDIVSSGSTLASNGLKEVLTVQQSEAVLIASPTLDRQKQKDLDELLFRIEAVRSAAGKKYVLMNAPRSAVDSIVEVLPGIKSPTVMPLADPEWCSIHTVVEASNFWQIIGQLRRRGAQGVLVLPIEKMIL